MTNLRKKWIWIFLFFIVLVCLQFNYFEIIIGEIMLATNSIRPKKGRLWVEELKDRNGITRVDSIVTQTEQNQISGHIKNFNDLKMAVSLSETYIMKREEFLTFYRSLPNNIAKSIHNPEIVYELMKTITWKTVRFTLYEHQLGIFCLDSYGEILTENYINFETPKKEIVTRLDKYPKFQDRIISGSRFQSVYDHLSLNLQRQIINDKYKLIQWGSNLIQVGIADRVENGTVEIGFEIMIEYGTKIEIMFASEIAIGWLIKYLNEQEGITVPPVRTGNPL